MKKIAFFVLTTPVLFSCTLGLDAVDLKKLALKSKRGYTSIWEKASFLLQILNSRSWAMIRRGHEYIRFRMKLYDNYERRLLQ